MPYRPPKPAPRSRNGKRGKRSYRPAARPAAQMKRRPRLPPPAGIIPPPPGPPPEPFPGAPRRVAVVKDGVHYAHPQIPA